MKVWPSQQFFLEPFSIGTITEDSENGLILEPNTFELVLGVVKSTRIEKYSPMPPVFAMQLISLT